MKSKIGRPESENPKDFMLRCRTTTSFKRAFNEYCKAHKVTMSYVVMTGIREITGIEVE